MISCPAQNFFNMEGDKSFILDNQNFSRALPSPIKNPVNLMPGITMVMDYYLTSISMNVTSFKKTGIISKKSSIPSIFFRWVGSRFGAGDTMFRSSGKPVQSFQLLNPRFFVTGSKYRLFSPRCGSAMNCNSTGWKGLLSKYPEALMQKTGWSVSNPSSLFPA